ncbi:beta-1,3-N-acetylglucosaminyltransferase manic fringe-like isoform X1 [Dysidea avara]|uniref:beta-1,3-N-acetylglucosaminyltransferase manic fringe-like isoform X1 n=1 Tax=Dysidea avara TaxID=196820 RepID=UPI00332704DC
MIDIRKLCICGRSSVNGQRFFGVFTVVMVTMVVYHGSVHTYYYKHESQRGLSEGYDSNTVSTPSNPTVLPYRKITLIHGKMLEDVSNPHCGGNIFYSVKTTSQLQYYRKRIMVSMLTWFQAVDKNKLSIVTDSYTSSENDDNAKFIKEEGYRLLISDCPASHEMIDLCCKTTAEYRAYYSDLEKHENETEKYQWFCHFDDDMFVNVPALSNLLSKYDPRDPLYIGRWDDVSWHGPMSEVHYVGLNAKEQENIKRLNQTIKMKKYWYGNGCGYCVSHALMMEARDYFTGNLSFCNFTWTPDDVSVAVIFTALLGHKLTNVDEMHSQREDLSKATLEETKSYMTISSNKLVNLNSPFSDDEYKFMALHCLLYPNVSWCKGHRITTLN